MKAEAHIRELINRLARVDAAVGWVGDLNPTQRAVLIYLSRANQFSRSPSHVSSYLGTTRGTTSQSLKSLLQKGYVNEKQSMKDKRVISYDLTAKGRDVSNSATPLEDVFASLGEDVMKDLQTALSNALRVALTRNGNREFGACQTCIHHKSGNGSVYCMLLEERLAPHEAYQICAEQVSA